MQFPVKKNYLHSKITKYPLKIFLKFVFFALEMLKIMKGNKHGWNWREIESVSRISTSDCVR